MVSTPVKSQATRSHPALPIWRDMSAETMKIPEPIITPTTTITESNRPRPRVKVGSCGVATGGLDEVTGALWVINILVILEVLMMRATQRPRLGGCRLHQVSTRRHEASLQRMRWS